MAQPTNCDGSRDSSRLGHNYLRRTQWRRRLPRAPRRRPRRSGSSSGSLGVFTHEHPFFLAGKTARSLASGTTTQATKITARRARRQSARRLRVARANPSAKGGISHGKEGSQEGSQEGGEEAVTPPRPWREGRGLSAPLAPVSSLSASTPHYRSFLPSHTVTFRTKSPRRISSTTSIPSTTRPNAV